MKNLNVPITRETKDKLDNFAKDTGRLKKWIVDKALNEYLDNMVKSEKQLIHRNHNG